MTSAETINQFVDTDRYPIADGPGHGRSALVASCQKQLTETSGVQLEGFIRPDAVAAMAREVRDRTAMADVISNYQNPYMSDEDKSLPITHPARCYDTWNSKSLCRDRMVEDGTIAALFQRMELLEFVRDCLALKTLHHYRDPMVGYMVNLIYDGDSVPWHFDTNGFSVSILLQVPEQGGVFEFAPNIRSEQSENFDGVSNVLNDGHDNIVKLPAMPGDLLIFQGRNSLHRVTAVSGAVARYSLIFGYTVDPDVIGTATRRLRHFGRCHEMNREYEASLPN